MTPPISPVSPTSADEHITVTPFAARRKSETVTAAVALAAPDVAVIVADPVATAVTKPADETVATDSADVAHVTVAPEIADPPVSFTVAASVVVSANEVNLRLSGDRVSEDAT